MKVIKAFAAAMACVLLSVTGAQARELNQAEENAQKSMMSFLKTLNYSPAFDKRDNSVNFKKGDILYWITVNGNSASMRFTLHRKPIKMKGDKDSPRKVARKCEIAERAANMVTARQDYKAFLNGTRVEFEYPVIASSVKEYQTVFPKVLAAMSNAGKDFDACYTSSRVKTDSIHNYWSNIDTIHIVLPQHGRISDSKEGKMLSIANISIRSVNALGGQISAYDEGLRKGKIQFIQPRVNMQAAKKGVYKLGLQIINPDGRILVPSKGATYTTVTTVDIDKAKKPDLYELEKFGTTDTNFWKPGEYKLLFFEDDTKIYEDAFHIL